MKLLRKLPYPVRWAIFLLPFIPLSFITNAIGEGRQLFGAPRSANWEYWLLIYAVGVGLYAVGGLAWRYYEWREKKAITKDAGQAAWREFTNQDESPNVNEHRDRP